MRKFIAISTALLLMAGCEHKSGKTVENTSVKAPQRHQKVCSSDTPLAKVGNETITVAYYKGIEKTIPKWALEKFYSGEEGKKKILQKIVDRRLIVLYEENKGLFDKPEIKDRFERFEIHQLALRYLNSQIKDYSVTDKEVEEAIKKYYKGKKVTPMEKHFIKMDLEAQKLQKLRDEAFKEVQKQIQFRKVNLKNLSDNTVVAVYNGKEIRYSDVKPLVRNSVTEDSLKNAVTYYVLYLKALDKGMDKEPDFASLINRMKENKAVRAFERELAPKIKVSDEEIKKYYEEHKSEMKTPAQAYVIIYQFKDKEKAKKVLDLINKGKSPQEAIPPEIFKTSKMWRVMSTDVGKIPVATLVFEEKQDKAIVELPNGTTLLAIVKKRIPPKPIPYGDAYSSIKRTLLRKKFEETANKMLSEMKKKYGVTYYYNNLDCVM